MNDHNGERRVVVTGMGIFGPLGITIDSFRKRLFAGECAIEQGTYSPDDDLSITLPVAAIREGEDVISGLGRDMARADPYSRFAIAAAEQAIVDSGLNFEGEICERTATLIGTGIGGQETSDDTHYQMLKKGRRPHPLTILRIIPNAAASHLSIRHGLTGPSFAISSACSSAAHTIGMCADIIRMGRADVGICGASEKVLTYGALEAWKAMHILASDMCRPFSKDRNGLVIGEGAGMLVLEDYEHAKKRGAAIHAELVGFGMNADGNDMINPSVDGAARAMEQACGQTHVSDPEKIYINAHGTGTLLNDPTETKAIRQAFGNDAEKLIVSSTKSMHGHLLGAAGGIEAIASILALQNQCAPPTINLDNPDPECDLNYAPNEAVERSLDLGAVQFVRVWRPERGPRFSTAVICDIERNATG